MVCHYLEAWGCPRGLVADLASALESLPEGDEEGVPRDGQGRSADYYASSATALPPSRTLLLALAWLTGNCGMFERELRSLQPRVDRLFLLPPLPEVRQIVGGVLR